MHASVEGLLLDVTELAVDIFGEVFNGFRMHVPIELMRNDARGVVLVLNFHASELADVHVAAEVLARSESLLDTLVQIKGLVCFVLAVRDAKLLLWSLSKSELAIDAVLVALGEQEFWERGRKQGLALMTGVVCPIRHYLLKFIIINSYIITIT